jgi:hypothetical protein
MNRIEMLKVILMEECGEFQQAISKCLRFTDSHKYHLYHHTNAEAAQIEFNDVIALVDMVNEGGLDLYPDKSMIAAKKIRVEDLLKVSLERGTLDKSDARAGLIEDLALALFVERRQADAGASYGIDSLLRLVNVPGVAERARYDLEKYLASVSNN